MLKSKPTKCYFDETIEIAGSVNTESLLLEWSEAPWDTSVMGYPVIQISRLSVRGPAANSDIVAYETVRDRVGCGLVSCRLPSDSLCESMFLEEHGFKFIELIYQPELSGLQDNLNFDFSGLTVRPACDDDISSILNIADNAFHNERFHIDPRLNPRFGNQRYCNWIKSSLLHRKQELYVVLEKSLLVSFFITELLPDRICYWHLNAVSPNLQGKGYGRRSWLAMLELSKEQGVEKVRTSIVARNYRVLNLYSSLGFRFSSPKMTFHWVRRS
ncbi:MAG: GNAT family N-acetyltransferase [Sedimenticola sp.]